MKSLTQLLNESILAEAKTAKTCPLHEKYYYFPGNYKMVGDKFKGDSVSFSYWGYGIRDKATKAATMKLFTEITGETKFMDYISDKFLGKSMGFKAAGNKTVYFREVGENTDTEMNVSDMCVKYLAAAIQEIEIPVTDSGFKKMCDSGELKKQIDNKLEEFGIKFGAFKLGKIKGNLFINTSVDLKKKDGRAIHVNIRFKASKIPDILINLTFFNKEDFS